MVFSSSVKEFYVGVAMIYDANTPYDVERVGPAIDIAIEKVNSDILNSSYKVVKVERHYGSVCSNSRASGKTLDQTLMFIVKEFNDKNSHEEY